MNNQYTAVISQDGGYWIGWIKEISGVNCQENTKEELIETLRVTLNEALEFNQMEALNSVGKNYSEEIIYI